MNSKQKMDTYTWIILISLFTIGASVDVHVRQGESLELTLPTVKSCGQYTLLNPVLRPVVVIEGQNTTNIIEWYSDRAYISQIEEGFLLTIQAITVADEGKYKIAASAISMVEACVHEPYIVTVTGSNGEYLKPWTEWTFCVNQCSPYTKRSRSRECNIRGGCEVMGAMTETQSCDKADNCSHWNAWGLWGTCSAKCGKGFKMRKRVCLNGNSSLVRSSECRGVASQSHMCLTVCEVVGAWTQWSEWSNCSKSCDVTDDVRDSGTRTRQRTCSTDTSQRLVTENCTGNRTEAESCGITNCPDPKVNTTIPVIGTSRDQSDIITIVSMVAGIICVVVFIIIFVCVMVLRRRRVRRDSVPTLRPADSANNRRVKKKSTERRSVPTSAQIDSGNVYSDLTSGAYWPSTEFDSSYDIDSKAFSQHCGGIADIDNPDADLNGSDFDSDFDDAADQPGRNTICERSEIIYETSRKSFQRTFDGNRNTSSVDKMSTISSEDYNVVTENQCYEPPELWSSNDVISSFDSVDARLAGSTENVENSVQQKDEAESVYYEPPDESKEKAHIAEMKRQESEMTDESIYENCGFERELENDTDVETAFDENENSYEVPANCLCEKDDKTGTNCEVETKVDTTATEDTNDDKAGISKVRMRNGSIVTFDEKTNSLTYEPIYMNEKVGRESGIFYDTPKYTYGLSMKDKDDTDDHIYDIPKFPNGT